MPPRASKMRPAFSLVELALTAVILAVFAALAAPRYAAAVARYRLDAAAVRVASEIDRARSAAASRSSAVSVDFDPAADTLVLRGLAGLGNDRTDATARLSEPPYDTDLAAADFAGGTTLTFDGYGKPLAGGTVTLRQGSVDLILTVSADAGRVSRP